MSEVSRPRFRDARRQRRLLLGVLRQRENARKTRTREVGECDRAVTSRLVTPSESDARYATHRQRPAHPAEATDARGRRTAGDEVRRERRARTPTTRTGRDHRPRSTSRNSTGTSFVGRTPIASATGSHGSTMTGSTGSRARPSDARATSTPFDTARAVRSLTAARYSISNDPGRPAPVWREPQIGPLRPRFRASPTPGFRLVARAICGALRFHRPGRAQDAKRDAHGGGNGTQREPLTAEGVRPRPGRDRRRGRPMRFRRAHACRADPVLFFKRSTPIGIPTELCDLYGRRLVICNETTSQAGRGRGLAEGLHRRRPNPLAPHA